MTTDVPRPAWETELGLRVAADEDLAAEEKRYSAHDHGELWSSARWAAVAADLQEGTNMSEGDMAFTSPDTLDEQLGYAEHLLDNLDEVAAETAWTWEMLETTGDHWSIFDDIHRTEFDDRYHRDNDSDGDSS